MTTIAPNTIAGLIAAAKVRAASIVSSFWGFTTKSGQARAPQIVGGWMAWKQTATDERFPYLLVTPVRGVDSAEGAEQDARATIAFVIGVHSDADDGWLDALHLVDAIRQSLEGEPLLAGTDFEHVGPLEWEMPDEQPRPQWHAVVTTTFLIPRPRRVIPEV